MDNSGPRSLISSATDRVANLKDGAKQSTDHGSLLAKLSDNPFFTAGFGLASLGAILRLGQQGIRRGASLLRQRLLVDLEITRHDKSYPWILNWMTRQYQLQASAALNGSSSDTQTRAAGTILSRLVTRFMRLHHLSMETHISQQGSSGGGASNTTFSLVPGHGRHILHYRNVLLAVHRERTGKSFDTAGQPFETMKLTTLYAHRDVFQSIFEDAHALSLQSIEGKTVVYTCQNMTWMPLGEPKRKRPFTSVVLADDVADGIYRDVAGFLAARTWYLDRGIPYRRGYLLHGPPGTGKTSFVQALAGKLDFSIAMLSLSQHGLHDDLLNRLLLNVPPRTIVLLEDADAAFVNRRQRDGEGYSGASVTFSGLLNALDGVASAEERIVFMTTNHIENLDQALVRPGRVDMTVRLGAADESQVMHMWDRFYSGHEGERQEDLRRDFRDKAIECGIAGQISTAELQGLFLFNKDDPRGAIAMVPDLVAQKATGR